MNKDSVFSAIDALKPVVINMSDNIFDNPELSGNEKYASALLEDYLENNGFSVERGLGSLGTAFRAVYTFGDDPQKKIGLLCEYDALEGLGHGCGHHMQGPSICAAAIALKECIKDEPFQLIVYGTPAEEKGAGKVTLLNEGYFKDIDVALMMHGSPTTCVDIKSMAVVGLKVVFTGKKAHAALKPDDGRSALDGLILSFNGIEFLREHILEDSRIHYTIGELPGPANIVPGKAVGIISIRSYDTDYLLNDLFPRVKEVFRGASIMTGTTVEIIETGRLKAKIPVNILNDVVMENARLVNAPDICPPREKTGSSDFGNLMYEVPGSCIRIAFVPAGTSSHSQTFIDYGKSEQAHDALIFAAKILAGTACDLIYREGLLDQVKEEFKNNKSKASNRYSK